MRTRDTATKPGGERFRRSPALVFYWTGTHPVCFDCVTARRTHVTPDVLSFLQLLAKWQHPAALARAHPGRAEDVKALLEALAARGLLERRSASKKEQKERRPSREWMPDAAFFQFGTRMTTQPDSPVVYDAKLRGKAHECPQPAPTKSMSGMRLDLPYVAGNGSMSNALVARRTWRRFSARPTVLSDLATLLHLTWGVQRWGVVEGQGKIALKTSPSGGARHSLEAYVVALNVAGVAPGLYHYDAGTHELVDLDRRITKDRVAYALANQRWFLGAGALVVLSAVFERAMWRYPSSRAYRAILTEAGHLDLTFWLVAMARGLAPFCTMAVRDRDLEGLIGLDGVSESAMYVVGVGTRPKGRVATPGQVPTRGEYAAG